MSAPRRGVILPGMRTHEDIDRRSLALARAVADKIEADPARKGLQKARAVCARWLRDNPCPAVSEWMDILRNDWPAIRAVLLDETENGKRLRQSNPFCGILSPLERWAIYRQFRHEPKAA